jgi:hypothetical protein
MRYPLLFPQILLGALLTLTSDGQLITITRTHSVCGLTSTLSSMLSSTLAPSPPPSSSPAYASTTTSSLTVSMSPAPVDQQINAGAPFTIQILPVGQPPSKEKRQATTPFYLTSSGALVPNSNDAAIFKLVNQQLFADGLIESTSSNIPYQVFKGSQPINAGQITTIFSVNQGLISWIAAFNPFVTSSATFYQGFAPQDSLAYKAKRQTGQMFVYALCSGSPNTAWSRVSMSAGRKFRLSSFQVYACIKPRLLQSWQMPVLRRRLLAPFYLLLIMGNHRHQSFLQLQHHRLSHLRNQRSACHPLDSPS